MIRGSTQIQPAIKPGQRITLNGHAGTVEQAGAYNIILKDDQGKRVVIPTKSVADKEIVIESGPRPETQESAAAMAEGKADYTSSTAPAA
ncbi:MAG: mechanosensitive ion channel [Anaerolineae bacterium]|nr:mechanosensitive ion channel [Anaerolineae bacterium]